MPKNALPFQSIPYHKTGYFSKLICDYLAEKEALESFYGSFPKVDNFKVQIKEKRGSFNSEARKSLVKALKRQYENNPTSEATLKNIASLSEINTFTITTGHQLNLMTGPLYFLYKIFSVINLAEKLKKQYPDSNFVPVFWMATEDHDFDEINYFNLFGKKLAWERESGGAVGELSTEGLKELHEQLESELGNSNNARELRTLFAKSYLEHDNLADATRFLANHLFSSYGLVIIDGNDRLLKKAFIPFAKKELLENQSHKKISQTSEKLKSLGYPEQVFPREINLFYLADGVRGRIVENEGNFQVMDTELVFSKEEILELLESEPERFSPNALLRPLYQEIVLPNLCYVGGGGELAYWFQLKDYFKSVEVPFPILLLRNSALLLPSKLTKKLSKLNTKVEALFQTVHDLEATYTKQHSNIEIDFSKQKEFLKQQFKALYEVAKQTDASFTGAVGAQEKKQLNGLDHLEKRLLKAEKRRHLDELNRLIAIQAELFPNNSLQERTINFSEFYLEFGSRLFSILKEKLDPLKNEFTILEL